jgi:hypothetical protein
MNKIETQLAMKIVSDSFLCDVFDDAVESWLVKDTESLKKKQNMKQFHRP